MSDARLSWLILDGLLPLTGAGILYILWGLFRYAATDDKKNFSYHWLAAADPLGWLYGAVIIAGQSAQRNFVATGSQVITWLCAAGGLASLLLLVAAMTDKGGKASWKPPASLQVFAVVLVLAILYAGFQVQASTTSGGTP